MSDISNGSLMDSKGSLRGLLSFFFFHTYEFHIKLPNTCRTVSRHYESKLLTLHPSAFSVTFRTENALLIITIWNAIDNIYSTNIHLNQT